MFEFHQNEIIWQQLSASLIQHPLCYIVKEWAYRVSLYKLYIQKCNDKGKGAASCLATEYNFPNFTLVSERRLDYQPVLSPISNYQGPSYKKWKKKKKLRNVICFPNRYLKLNFMTKATSKTEMRKTAIRSLKLLPGLSAVWVDSCTVGTIPLFLLFLLRAFDFKACCGSKIASSGCSDACSKTLIYNKPMSIEWDHGRKYIGSPVNKYLRTDSNLPHR